MTRRLVSARILPWILGTLALASLTPARAQWADYRYKNRIPVTITNSNTDRAFAVGNLVTATVPTSALAGAIRPDGADMAVYYGSTQLACKPMIMGGSTKVVLPLQTALPAASPAYALSENTSAGKTDYASLPTGTKLDFGASTDDGSVVINLPFEFPFKTAKYTTLTVSTDGFCVPGTLGATYWTYNENAASKLTISPYQADFDTTPGGVWADTTDPTKVTIRWECAPSGGSTVTNKMAVVLYPNGQMRFVYGSPCVVDTSIVTWTGQAVGVGVGDPNISLIQQNYAGDPPFDYTLAQDILYTQTIPVPSTSSGYYLYFNGPSVATKPTAPAGVIDYDFTTGNLNGWKSVNYPNTPGIDLKISVDPLTGTTVAHMDTTYQGTGGDCMFVAPNDTGEQTMYSKVHPVETANNTDKAIAQIMRWNYVEVPDANGNNYLTQNDPPGLAVFYEYGTAETRTYVTAPVADPDANGRYRCTWPGGLGNGPSYTFNNSNIQYLVTASWDSPTTSTSWLAEKVWQTAPSDTTAGDTNIGGWAFQIDSQQLVGTGHAALNVTALAYVYNVVIVPNAFVELAGTTVGSVETVGLPGTGAAVIEGIAYDASIGQSAPLAGITVTVKNAGGTTLGTAVTLADGKYRLVVAAGATAATYTVRGQGVGRSGSVTVDVVEANNYTVNIPITFGARATGKVTDAYSKGPIPGITVNLLQPGTTTVVVSAVTDANGTYLVDFDTAGTFDVKCSVPGYTDQTVPNKVYPTGASTTVDFAMVGLELAVNGGFENSEPVTDPAGLPGAVKPVGWQPYFQDASVSPNIFTVIPISNDAAALKSKTSTNETAYYVNDATLAHSGTKAIAIKREVGHPDAATITQWTTLGGNLAPTVSGLYYKVEYWVNSTPGMYTQGRFRFYTAPTDEIAATGSGGDQYMYGQRSRAGWQRVVRYLPVPTTNQRYMRTRLYGDTPNALANQPYCVAYYDDVSIKPVAPVVITGKVVDGSGAGVNRVGVCAVPASAGRNAAADPEFFALTDSSGNFTLRLFEPGPHRIQLWRMQYALSSEITIDPATVAQPLVLTAPSYPAVNFSAGCVATIANNLGGTGNDLLDNCTVMDGFDVRLSSWPGSRWSELRNKNIYDASELPIKITADLGQVRTFDQISICWHGGRMWGNYDIDVSTDGTTWTRHYTSIDIPWANADMGSSLYVDSIGVTATARYVRLNIRDLWTNIMPAIFDIWVEAKGVDAKGKVVDKNGAPLQNAAVAMVIPGGKSFNAYYSPMTAADGTYTLRLPIGQKVQVVAHRISDGDTVVGLSDKTDVTASLMSPVIPTIALADPVPNVMPDVDTAGYSPYSTPSVDEGANPATSGADHNLTSRWGTAYQSLTPASPLTLTWNPGTNMTFNQVNILWESGFANNYKIQVSNDDVTYTDIYTTTSGVGGYPTAVSGQYVDVVQVPTTTAKYVRIYADGKEGPYMSIWELQLGLVGTNPQPPFALTRKALQYAAGISTASAADLTTLNVVTTGASAGKIDILDAVSLAKQGK